MDVRKLGPSGLETPRLVLGGNVFGWTVDETAGFELLDAFVAGGFNMIDTADIYTRWVDGAKGGESETIIGAWMKSRGNRDKVIIATKAGMEMGPIGLIPEQIWDTDPIPAYGLVPGKPSGSAMPLVWAHAEFAKLCHSLAIGRPAGGRLEAGQHRCDAVHVQPGADEPGRCGEDVPVSDPEALRDQRLHGARIGEALDVPQGQLGTLVSGYAMAVALFALIAGPISDRFGRRPSIDTQEPDLWLNLYIHDNRAVISVATSGGSLHRRAYRTASVEAPMQETVAAAVLRYTGWDGEQPLYDPMCGAGTLLSEALMHYCRVPAGYLRPHFGFERLPDFDAPTWERVKQEMDAAIRPLPPGLVAGSDVSRDAVDAAAQNQANLPSGRNVALSVRDFRAIPSLSDHVIVCNPPYGLRLGRGGDIGAFYRELGDFLKHRCTGSTAYVYFGKRELLKHIGLRPAWKKPLVSGALDGRLAKFEMY